jgi:hypothetical protein
VINVSKKAISDHQIIVFDDIPGSKIHDYCSPDGNFLFVVSIDGKLSLYDNTGNLVDSIDLEFNQDEEVKAMAVSPCCEYIAVAYWNKELLTSSIYFVRITNPKFFKKYKTPSRLRSPVKTDDEPIFKVIEKFNFNTNFPRLKKNVNSFFLSLSLDTVVNSYPILTAIQLFNEKNVFGFILNGDDVIPTEPRELGGEKAVVNSYFYNGEVYCVDNNLRLNKIKYFIR